jgi:hypothetical protein
MVIINFIKIFIRFFLSFLKNDWQIYDYPLKYKIQNNVEDNSKWLIQIINWRTLCGLGRTREEALKDLKKNFIKQIKNKGFKPRPGTKVPIKYASTEKIDNNIDFLDDFLEKVLDIKKDSPVFISDLSSLYDFSFDDVEKYYIKIKKYYNKDVRHIKDGNISKILEAIKY